MYYCSRRVSHKLDQLPVCNHVASCLRAHEQFVKTFLSNYNHISCNIVLLKIGPVYKNWIKVVINLWCTSWFMAVLTFAKTIITPHGPLRFLHAFSIQPANYRNNIVKKAHLMKWIMHICITRELLNGSTYKTHVTFGKRNSIKIQAS